MATFSRRRCYNTTPGGLSSESMIMNGTRRTSSIAIHPLILVLSRSRPVSTSAEILWVSASSLEGSKRAISLSISTVSWAVFLSVRSLTCLAPTQCCLRPLGSLHLRRTWPAPNGGDDLCEQAARVSE